jgi:hypothetical protein
MTLQQLYEVSGDAEAYGVQSILSSFTGVATIVLLCEILNLLATLNCFMQRKTADFSRLKIILDSVLDQLKSLKLSDAEWCSDVEKTVATLQTEHDIIINDAVGVTRRSTASAISSVDSFRKAVALPYIDALIVNNKSRFSEKEVSLLIAMSIFNPAQLPDSNHASFNSYGNKEVRSLASFYGEDVEVELHGATFKSPKVLDGEGLISEWPVFRRALLKEKQALMSAKSLTKSPTFQQVFDEMHSSEAYVGIFPETYTLINIMMTLPVGTATVERSFSQMKMIKTRLRNRLSDENLARLMRIAIEGPEAELVDFDAILDIFKTSNRRIIL